MLIMWPIAGKGTRFLDAGYSELKPFIKINNHPMIEFAISSIGLSGKHCIVANKLNSVQVNTLNNIQRKYSLELEIVELGRTTAGQAETCYLALEKIEINKNEQLIISNCDQFTPWNPRNFMNLTKNNEISGIVTTYRHRDFIIGTKSPYSHVKVDDNNFAIQLEEKIAISQNSLNGIYYWKEIKLFQESAKKYINTVTTGEKFVSFTYNYLIKEGYKIKIFEMKENEFYSLGTPKDLNTNKNKIFLNS